MVKASAVLRICFLHPQIPLQDEVRSSKTIHFHFHFQVREVGVAAWTRGFLHANFEDTSPLGYRLYEAQHNGRQTAQFTCHQGCSGVVGNSYRIRP